MRALTPTLRTLIVLSMAACATGGGEDGDSGPRFDPNTLTAAEMDNYLDRSVDQVIRQLRPRWLTTRGNVSLTTTDNRLPSVVLDGQPTTLDILETMRAEEVDILRYINAADATMRFGTGYPNGAILVTSRRR